MRARSETMASMAGLIETAVRVNATLSETAYRATSLRAGDLLINRYEIGEALGVGGMGVVFEAFDRIAQEKIAVKVLRGDVGLSDELQARFLAEAKISRTLSHENIVRVYDVGATEHFYYLTMERLWGQSLRARLEELQALRRPFELSEFHDILQQLVEALRFANRTLVHRDIKPENIWITREGVVKLMDFGIARVVDSNQTYTQASIGTPRYMSPEQRDSPKDVDWRSDQYALGVVLHELLTGRRPEIGMPPPVMLRNDVSREWSEAIVKAMASEPSRRHATWQAFKEAFERPPAPRRSLWKFGLTGLLLAVVAGGVGYWLFEFGGIERGAAELERQRPPPITENDVAKQKRLEQQQRAAAEIAKQKAEAELQEQLAREQQAAEEALRREEAEQRAHAAELTRQAEAQRQAEAKRQAEARAQAEAKTQAEEKRRRASEQRAEAERKADAERSAAMERQALPEAERQAAPALAPPAAQSQPVEDDDEPRKKKRTRETGLIPPSF